jgi:hypothetical protein
MLLYVQTFEQAPGVVAVPSELKYPRPGSAGTAFQPSYRMQFGLDTVHYAVGGDHRRAEMRRVQRTRD